MNFVETIKAAGVVCDDGRFPILLEPEDAMQCFIINAVSVEPLVETDRCLCVMQPERVVAAAAAISEKIGAARTVIAVSADDNSAAQALAQAIAVSHTSVELFRTEPVYPANDDLILTRLVTGRVVSERGIPRNVSCALCSVSEALDILDAVDGAMVTDKYLTVSGAVKRPLLLKAPMGTRLSACIAEAGAPDKAGLIVGGPMRGKFLTNPAAIDAAVVTRTTDNLIVLPREHPLFSQAKLPLEVILSRARSACEQCRMCTEFCPRYGLGHTIRPNLIMRNLRRENEITDGDEYRDAFGDADNCCFCGVCDAVCPMGLQPRRVNAYFFGGLKKRDTMVPRERQPKPRETAGGIDTKRLTVRLGISDYGGFHDFAYRELTAEEVFIPFIQKPYRPALPLKHVGDVVKKGELLARDGSCTGIHASIGGTVTKISANGTHIKESEGVRA